MEISTLNGILKIDDNVKIYYCYRKKYDEFKDALIQETVQKIDSNKISELPESINRRLTERIKSIITELAGYGIYDKTVDDFIETNPGYVSLLNVYTRYLDTVHSITDTNAQAAEQSDRLAHNAAHRQVTGLDYGILTNDMLSYMTYDALNESKIRKQAEKAYEQYQRRARDIYNNMHTKTATEIKQYEQQVFIPDLKRAITEIISNLFAHYMSFQADQGKINLNALKGIDEKRSNDILENLSIVDEKAGLLLTSLNLCPYNLNAYVLALRYNLFDVGLGKGISFLNLADAFEQKLFGQAGYDYHAGTNIADIYKSYRSAFRAMALARGETEDAIFEKKIAQLYASKKRKLVQVLTACINANPDDMVQYFIKNQISLENFEKDISRLLPKALMKKEFIALQEHTNINLLSELEQIDSRYTFHSYEDINQFILQRFSVYKQNLAEFLEEKEKEKQQQVEQEKQEKIKEDKKAKRGFAGLIAFLLFLIFFPSVFKYCQYQYYVMTNGKPFAGVDVDTTPVELIELLGEPQQTETDGKEHKCIYKNVNTFGTECTIVVCYNIDNELWPNDTSKPETCFVSFKKDPTVTERYDYYFRLKFGKPSKVRDEGDAIWNTSDKHAYSNSSNWGNDTQVFVWMPAEN